MKEHLKKHYTIYILIGLVILTCLWLLPKGLSYSHDIEYHYSRINGLVNTIRNGDFIALIHDMLSGYGYANGLFYSNFFFYIPATLCLIGMGTVDAYKIFTVLINITTVVTSYYCFKSILKDNKTTLFTTIVYNLSLYRVMVLIVRGACGELLALAFIPLVILGLYEIIYRDYKKWYIFTIGFVLLLLSHLITTIIMGILCVIIILINYKRFLKEKDRIKYLLLSGIVGVLVDAFFLFPIIEQFINKTVNIFVVGSAKTMLHEYSVGIFEFFLPIAYSQKTLHLKNIGYGTAILLLIPIIFRSGKVKDKDDYSFAKILLIISLVLIFMSTSLFPWKLFDNYLSFIQFPWRLLIYPSTFIPLSLGIWLNNSKVKKNTQIARFLNFIILAGISIMIFMLLAYSFVYSFISPRKDVFREKIGLGEYLPAGIDVNSSFIGEPSAGSLDIDPYYETNNNDLKYIVNRKGKDIRIEYSNNNMKDTYLEIPVFNYLGYKADGAEFTDGNYHRMKLLLDNKESGEIHIYYDMTTVQKASYVLSAITIIGIGCTLIIVKKKKKK